jgi:regulator of ribonuclease activity A
MVRSTADLADEQGDGVHSCQTQFRNFGGRRVFEGRISTVRCFEDNVVLGSVLEQPGEGRVLVVDGGASLRVALLGDRIAGIAAAAGWQGIVINGAVRDVAVLATLDIGVKALGSNPRRSAKTGAGSAGIAVTFGEVTFAPGEHLVADDDGIIVLEEPPND